MIGGDLRISIARRQKPFPDISTRGYSIPPRSAPVRRDITFEARVIGTGSAGLGRIEPAPMAAEGVMLIVRPGQVLRIVTTGHTLLVPGGQCHHPTTAPRAPTLGRDSSG